MLGPGGEHTLILKMVITLFLLFLTENKFALKHVSLMHMQGRRRVLKSGTAIERHRCSPSAEGTRGGEHERGFDPLS